MKTQAYYNALLEKQSNICDMSTELSINCIGAVDDSNDISTRFARNDFYMMYVISGSMNIEFGDNSGVISSGDLLIMSPHTKYFYFASKDSGINYLWIHFTGRDAGKLLRLNHIETNRIISCGMIGGISECWKKLFNEFVINDEHFATMTTSIFKEILTLFSRRINYPDGKNRLLKSILYIHENYQKRLSVAELAKLENLSESHYRTVFSRIFGESPIDYITTRRIEAAVHLLENSDKKLFEISELVGYNDVYYFGRQFKKRLGVSPGKYRRNAR